MSNLLLLEDDDAIREGVEQHFLREGHTISAHALGLEAIGSLAGAAAGSRPRFDAALLDLSLPDIDGLDVLRHIRSDARLKALPVLLVSARSEEFDRVLGLELGADDYVSKPFSVRELGARLRALLRRSSPQAVAEAEQQATLTVGPLTAVPAHHLATVGGKPLELTRMEFELLVYFMRNTNRVLKRERIFHDVWGLEFLGESRTIDAHIRRIRAKLGPHSELLETVIGIGYRMGQEDRDRRLP